MHTRGLYRELGFSSMFDFATRKLGMSESEAGLRIRAAKVGRSFPESEELLARCEVNLTTLSLLLPVLNDDSLHLLHAARGKSKKEVQALIATHAPKPDAPDLVRRLPPLRPPRASARAQHVASVKPPPRETSDVLARTNPNEAVAQPLRLLPDATPQRVEMHSTSTPRQAASPQPASITDGTYASASLPGPVPTPPPGAATEASSLVQLSADRHRIAFTAGRRVRDLLEEAQDLRRHRFPAGELEPIFERALELLVAEEKKRKFALTPTPLATTTTARPTSKHSRHIPHAVRRQAWTQHAGRCGFVATDGQRCQSRSRLEFHHVMPFALGGPSDAHNVVLLCQAHNALQAEHDFGRALIHARIQSTRPARPAAEHR